MSLNNLPIRQSKEFLRLIYESEDFEYARKRFDQYIEGLRRQQDDNMALGAFLALPWKKRHLRLQTDSPVEREIRYGAAITKNTGTIKFAWVEYLPTDTNYKIIKATFKKAYSLELEEILSLTI
jgi:hypothetical protein